MARTLAKNRRMRRTRRSVGGKRRTIRRTRRGASKGGNRRVKKTRRGGRRRGRKSRRKYKGGVQLGWVKNKEDVEELRRLGREKAYKNKVKNDLQKGNVWGWDADGNRYDSIGVRSDHSEPTDTDIRIEITRREKESAAAAKRKRDVQQWNLKHNPQIQKLQKELKTEEDEIAELENELLLLENP